MSLDHFPTIIIISPPCHHFLATFFRLLLGHYRRSIIWPPSLIHFLTNIIRASPNHHHQSTTWPPSSNYHPTTTIIKLLKLYYFPANTTRTSHDYYQFFAWTHLSDQYQPTTQPISPEWHFTILMYCCLNIIIWLSLSFNNLTTIISLSSGYFYQTTVQPP